ncbi:hypothetical protein HanIR_Chr02g0061881 [Helianthus annuus]|nr:hypothetical protein HanIR_Chr02g0061881 [Helianthus annuus]
MRTCRDSIVSAHSNDILTITYVSRKLPITYYRCVCVQKNQIRIIRIFAF